MSTGSVSPRRADTRRNHERILEVALETLTSTGEVSFNTIAKRAEVGVGTVYRHFPTPDALVLAVYRREVDNLLEIVPTLLGEHPPDEAFRRWVGHLARYMMTKHGLAGALSTATSSDQELFTTAYNNILGAVRTLLAANERAGTVRPGLDPSTVLRALGGLMHLNPREDWQRQAADLIDLVWRGLHTTG